MRRARNQTIAGIVGVLIVLGVAIAAVTHPGGANATAKSQVRPLSAASLRSDVRGAIIRAAGRMGVKAADIREVAAQGHGRSRAGMYVGRDARGRELVAFFAPHAFTTFTPAAKLAPVDRPLYASAAAQPGADSKTTGHVQLCGVVGPFVTRVEISLADRTSISADLVRLDSDGHSFFTYLSDDPSSFPGIVRAFDAKGQEVGSEDVSAAISPPDTG